MHPGPTKDFQQMTTQEVVTRPRVFYGWWIVAVSVLGAFLGATTSQLFTGAMLPSIQDGTGWSRSSITLAVTIGSIISGFSSPVWGRLVDAYGPRYLTAFGAVVVAAALFLISLSSAGHIILFYIGYIFARSVSQNTISGVVTRTTLVNWFTRRRGRTLGLVSMAVPLGGAILVPVAKVIADQWSWQAVYVLFASLILVMAPLSVLVLRRSPADMGLLPDGDGAAAVAKGAGEPEAKEYDFTVGEAMRTSAFWLLLLAQSVATFSIGGISFHQASYYKDQGIATAAIALAISAFALSGAFANALWGFLIEHVSERLLGAVTLFIAGLLPFYLLTVDSTFGALSFAVLFGLAARGEGSIIVVIQAQYFGRGSFGAINGISGPFTQIALGFGPTSAAIIYDSSGGSYSIAFILYGVLFIAAAAMIFLSRKPRIPESATFEAAATP